MGAGTSVAIPNEGLTDETKKAIEGLPAEAQKELASKMRTIYGNGKARYDTLQPAPKDAKFKLCVVQFKVPGAKNGGSDKGPDGNRIDSIPIANGVIAAGGECDLVLYDADKNKADTTEFAELTAKYDALIVRINPGQLSQGTEEGTQKRFDGALHPFAPASVTFPSLLSPPWSRSAPALAADRRRRWRAPRPPQSS